MLKSDKDIELDKVPPLLTTVMQNPKATSLPRAAGLLRQWKKWLKSLHDDGCGAVYSLEQITEWDSVHQEMVELATFTSDATKLCQTFPAVKNKKTRQKQAEDFKPGSDDLGPYLYKLKEALISGENPLKKKQDDDEAAPDDDDAQDVEEEQPKKKAKR